MTILFGMGVFRVLDHRRPNRKALKYSDSTLSFLEDALMRINHRIWLVEHILWWWMLPFSVGGLLIVYQIGSLVGWNEPTLYWKLGQGVVVTSVILGVVYWGNLWTARTYWKPRRDELQAITENLKAD